MRRLLLVPLLLVVCLGAVTATTTAFTLDGDTYPVLQELNGPTSPLSADTDGDGLRDERERRANLSPTTPDADGDGLPDGREFDLGADPHTVDTDRDGLKDGREADLGTDPTHWDTDEDGYPDVAEATMPDVLPDADPLKKDVYMELDYETGYCRPGRPNFDGAINETVQAFAQAPVDNPRDGYDVPGRNVSDGIRLHVFVDETVSIENSIAGGESAFNEHADNASAGYVYAVVLDSSDVQTVEGGGYSGVADDTLPVFVVGCPPGNTFMHELGHVLGLDPADYRGIDSTAVTAENYTSVMNYLFPGFNYTFSSQAGPNGFDDWEHIERTLPEHIWADIHPTPDLWPNETGPGSYDAAANVSRSERPSTPAVESPLGFRVGPVGTWTLLAMVLLTVPGTVIAGRVD